MQAIVYDRYGPPEVLRLADVPKPTPGDDEVLVKVHAVSLNRSDWETLTGRPLYSRIWGLLRPRRRILGSDIAGRVEAVGQNVRHLRPGDDVFGDVLGHMGGFAEYLCAPASAVARKPPGMSFEEAAAIPQAAAIALQGIRGRVRAGDRVLINGAGGGAGSFAVQLAAWYGAEVTGVDGADKLDFIRSLGADHVMDYAREDFTETGAQYDLILDVVAHRSVSAYARALRPNGRCLYVGGSVATLVQVVLLGPWIGRSAGKRIRLLVVRPNLEDLLYVAELCRSGTIAPAIDRRFPLREVPDALRYLGDGRAKGKVVIMTSGSGAM